MTRYCDCFAIDLSEFADSNFWSSYDYLIFDRTDFSANNA